MLLVLPNTKTMNPAIPDQWQTIVSLAAEVHNAHMIENAAVAGSNFA
jgi:hypothetical protein